MMLLRWVFDGLLVLALLWLAWQALGTPDLFKAIVLFIAFGLVMALAWVRLQAPDIALAEAAIGAGLTGALLLAALARSNELADRIGDRHTADSEKTISTTDRKWISLAFRLAPLLLLLALAGGLGYAVLSLPDQAVGLSGQVSANMGTRGVSNPVTAVLLNFRAYDTLLELGVLLVALLGVWSLGTAAAHRRVDPEPVLSFLVGVLVPMMMLMAGYLLWVGANAPGGAFQAGSVLAGSGILLLLSGKRLPARLTGWPLRLVLVLGLGIFVAVGVALFSANGMFLQFPSNLAGGLILFIEAAATLSIGVTLAALFLGGSPSPRPSPRGRGR
jgi:multisubunit Na+/H+ antiporter MnhB subunit